MRKIPVLQGEHAVAREEDVVLTTVLGSCIAVCLIDPARRIGGMNHFLLGEPAYAAAAQDALQRYGIHAMEVLINALMAHGAERGRLRAHLYGGANIVRGLGRIGSANANFARSFLEMEGITVSHEDVGGSTARRVEFVPAHGRSRCFHVAHAPEERPMAPFPAGQHVGELELFR